MPQKSGVFAGSEAGVIRIQEVIPVSKSRPYSSVSVKQVQLESYKGHAGQACAVGIDVAKLELIVVVRWSNGTFERPWRVKNPRELGELVARLGELASQGALTVAMESSGTYGDAARQAFADAGIILQRVSAKAVKDQAETFDGVPSQHDGKDAAIIADLCARGKGRSWALHCEDPAQQEMRYLVRKLDSAQRIKQTWCGKSEGLLARHWPEVTALLKVSGATLSGALARWGSPAALAADADAARVLARLGGRYLSPEKIAAVIESARTTKGVRMGDWQSRELREVAAAIVEQRRQINACVRRLKQVAAGQEVIAAQAPALGFVVACVLWTCVGDPHDYGCAAAYRKAMGLNLVERSSGQYRGQLRISKRGQRLGRKWLYFSALRWMRDPAVRRFSDAKKGRDGGKGSRAVVAVMRRLALAAWHLGLGATFDPARLFPGKRPGKMPQPCEALS
jgi:transposase